MFDFTWGNKKKWKQEPDAFLRVQPISKLKHAVEAASLLQWEEHCLECSPPDCYRDCSLFKSRRDKKCLRLLYGFVRDSRFDGLFGYGVDCRFQPWAKIETRFNPLAYSPRVIRIIDRINRTAVLLIDGFSTLLKPLSPSRKLTGAFNYFRKKLFQFISRGVQANFDSFIFECISPEEQPFRFILQCDHNDKILFLNAFDIQPGYNLFELPFSNFRLNSDCNDARIFLYPENNRQVRILITWLDFIRIKGSTVKDASPAGQPAAKVKCVAWDLDNTLWKGVLVEQGTEGIHLNETAREVIEKLDQRGVIHTIVSKNTHEQAWEMIKSLGLADYFVYPAINWGQKSQNIRQVAARINIGLDAIAFVDDSPFERAEVSSNLPMVRVYDEIQISQLPDLPEFDIPVTEMSRQRRLSYLAEMKREEFQEMCSDNLLDFLRSCQIRMEIFQPQSRDEKERCLELLQRSNQFNLSTRRYSESEFEELLSNDNVESFGFRCQDRFGDYGIVGFLSVLQEPEPQIIDLVISCRIAKKRVEHAFIDWLIHRYLDRGKDTLLATLYRTERNSVLAEVFDDMPFTVISQDDKVIRYAMDLRKEWHFDNVIDVVWREGSIR